MFSESRLRIRPSLWMGIITVVLAAIAPKVAIADPCRATPVTLREGAGAPVGAMHYGRPSMQAALSGDRVITFNGTRGPADHGDGRLIVWDGETGEPLVMYYNRATQRDGVTGSERPVPPNALALAARYHEFSADARYAAFERGDPLKRPCVDVYRDGVHVARYQNRRLGGFHGDTLVMYESGKKPRRLFVQHIGEPQNNRGVQLSFEGRKLSLIRAENRQQAVRGADNSLVAGQGVIVRTHERLRPGTSNHTLLFNPDTGEVRSWFEQRGTAGTMTSNIRLRVHSVDRSEDGARIFINGPDRVELALPFPAEEIPKLSFLDSLHVGPDHMMLIWREGDLESRRSSLGWAQVFDYATGMPLHGVPIRFPGIAVGSAREWMSQNQSARAVLLDERYLFIMAVTDRLTPPEQIDLHEGTATQLAWMEPIDDATVVLQIREEHSQRGREQAALVRQRREQIESNPLIRHMHAHGPTDFGEVEVYCRMGGPRCAEFRNIIRQRVAAENRAAEAANLRRIQQLYQGDRDIGYEARRRQECLRRKYAPTAIANPEFRGESTGTCNLGR